MGESSVVQLDWPAPRVARLRIARPAKRNAIDHAVRQQLIEALDALVAGGDVRALVLGGVEGVFSAGGDVPSMVGLNEAQARERMCHIAALCRRVAVLRWPVVSAVEGVAAGAAVGLALLGDRIVVGEGTRILFPFLRLGLVPDWGQPLTLPRRVGDAVARRLLCSDRPVTGDEALRVGLADVLVPDVQVMAEAIRLAQTLASLPQEAFARLKTRLAAPLDALEQSLACEEDDQAACLLGDDFREGYDAFVHKRAPDFINRPALQR